MKSTRWLFVATALTLLAAAGACDGDDDGGEGATRTPAASRETPGATGTAQPTRASTAVSEATPAQGTTPSAGRDVTADEAAAVLDSVVLKPADLPGTWTAQTDTTTDNAAAAAAEPDQAASIERCGRLLGRTVVLMPEDQVTRYISGDTVSFFTNATVFATAAGAADCAAEASARFADAQELVKSFGALFVRPAEVVTAPFAFPQVGDASFATTLTGKISAAGAEVDLTILVVAYLRGNVSVAVGSAAAFDPSAAELEPLVNLTVERVDAALE